MSIALAAAAAPRDTAPPADLEPESFAARLYEQLEPLARTDPDYGWALLIFCNALGRMFQKGDDYMRDTPEGPGWSVLMDVERCPDEALPWLAQFAGVRLLAGSTPEEQRTRIVSTDGFRRGTRDAMIGAARATLSDPVAGAVIFRERDGNPADKPDYAYYLTVRTYASQTPDPALTLRALLAQKPGGIVLAYSTLTGQDYAALLAGHVDYADVRSSYAIYEDVRADLPF